MFILELKNSYLCRQKIFVYFASLLQSRERGRVPNGPSKLPIIHSIHPWFLNPFDRFPIIIRWFHTTIKMSNHKITLNHFLSHFYAVY